MTTVTVERIYPQKEGAKTGSFKTTNGDFFRIWPDKMHLISEGGTYDIIYKSDTWQGKTFNTVTRINGAANGTAAGVASRGGGAIDKSMEMFVMGTIGRCLHGTGTFPDYNTLVEWVKTAKTAWERGMKEQAPPKPTESFRDPLDDEIPF